MNLVLLGIIFILSACNGVHSQLNHFDSTDSSRTQNDGPLPEAVIENLAPVISGLDSIDLVEDQGLVEVPFAIYDDRTLYSCEKSIEFFSGNLDLISEDQITISGMKNECLLSFEINENQSGLGYIYVFFNDGTQTSGVFLQVNVSSVNDVPEISTIEDQSYIFDSNEEGHTVNLEISDLESDILCSQNSIYVQSSDLDILTRHQMELNQTDSGDCTLNLKPKKPGVVELTVYVDDGTDFVTKTFNFSIKQSEVSFLNGNSGTSVFHQGVTQDDDFNTYITGYKNAELEGLAQVGEYDGYVFKYDQNFQKVWGFSLGKFGGTVYAKKIQATSSGYIYVVGETNVSLYSENLIGTYDGFVSKYDLNGLRIWTRQFGAPSSQVIVNNLTVDKDDNVFITGSATNGVGGEAKIGDYDGFFIKFNKNGNQKMLRLFGETDAHLLNYSIALDRDENIYLAGSTDRGLYGKALTGNSDAYILKYSKYGDRLQTNLYGDSGSHSSISKLIISQDDKIYFAGQTTGNLSGNTLTGNEDIFVGKSYRSGELIWLNQMGASSSYTLYGGFSMGENGDLYLIGRVNGHFEENSLIGTYDLFAQKFSSSGELIETIMKGKVSGMLIPKDAIMNSLNNLIVVGTSDKGIDDKDLIGVADGFVSTSFSFPSEE